MMLIYVVRRDVLHTVLFFFLIFHFKNIHVIKDLEILGEGDIERVSALEMVSVTHNV
jgi:hypothetical protein